MNDLLVLSIATFVAVIGCAISVIAAVVAHRQTNHQESESFGEMVVELDQLKATAAKTLAGQPSAMHSGGSYAANVIRLKLSEALPIERKPALSHQAEKIFACR
jgi:hypothetical protein